MPKLSARALAALAVAVFADFLQLVLFPFFFEGFLSPIQDTLDVAVASALTGLLGWHWVFLPTALVELVPGADLAPFWSVAAFMVVMGRTSKQPGTVSPATIDVAPMNIQKAN